VEEKILIVDDEEPIRTMVVRALKPLGYTVRTAADYSAAEELLRADDFNIVLTDKNLPGKDDNQEGGLDVLRFVKENYPSTEVIIITGYASVDSAVESIRFGAFDYIIKPFKIEELKEKIERILDFQASISPEISVPIYKKLLYELADVLAMNAALSHDEKEKILQSLKNKLDTILSALNQRERIILLQREALSNISHYALQMQDKSSADNPLYGLIERICAESSKRI